MSFLFSVADKRSRMSRAMGRLKGEGYKSLAYHSSGERCILFEELDRNNLYLLVWDDGEVEPFYSLASALDIMERANQNG